MRTSSVSLLHLCWHGLCPGTKDALRHHLYPVMKLQTKTLSKGSLHMLLPSQSPNLNTAEHLDGLLDFNLKIRVNLK